MIDFLAHRNKNSFTWCLALYLIFFFIYLSIYEYVLRLWNCPAVQQTLSQISVLLNRAVQLIVMISKSHYGEVQYSNQKGLKLGLGNVLIYTNKLKQTVKKMVGSQHEQYQNPETKSAKWNSTIINFIIHTWLSYCDVSTKNKENTELVSRKAKVNCRSTTSYKNFNINLW